MKKWKIYKEKFRSDSLQRRTKYIIANKVANACSLSGSQSSLQALISPIFLSICSAIIQWVHEMSWSLESLNLTVSLAWIPGHAYIAGNEAVDALAKSVVGHAKLLEILFPPDLNSSISTLMKVRKNLTVHCSSKVIFIWAPISFPRKKRRFHNLKRLDQKTIMAYAKMR